MKWHESVAWQHSNIRRGVNRGTSSRRRPGPIPRNPSMALAGSFLRKTISCGYGSWLSPGRLWGGIALPYQTRSLPALAAVTPSRSRGGFRPSFASCVALENAEGAGKAGWPLHPGPRAKEICASARTTGTGGDHTGLPRAMVYGLYVFSPVNRRLPPSPSRSSQLCYDLAPAWARQDHTTSPSANVPYVYRHIPVHRIPLHVRDDAYAPCLVRSGGSRQQIP